MRAKMLRTLVDRHIVDYKVIFLGIVVGSALGAVLAIKVHMTAMPQMVALLNGFGGAASTLVAGAALLELQGKIPTHQFTIATGASGIIGAVTFWGSLVAWAKLEEIVPGRPILFKGQQR